MAVPGHHHKTTHRATEIFVRKCTPPHHSWSQRTTPNCGITRWKSRWCGCGFSLPVNRRTVLAALPKMVRIVYLTSEFLAGCFSGTYQTPVQCRGGSRCRGPRGRRAPCAATPAPVTLAAPAAGPAGCAPRTT